MKRRYGPIAAVTLALTLISTFINTPAAHAAYACHNDGRPLHHSYTYVGVTGSWPIAIDLSRGRWNTAGVGAQITESTWGGHTITVVTGAGNQNWYGSYTYQAFARIQINTDRITVMAPSGQFWNWARSTTTHEFGHGLRLYDNPNTSSASLMKHNRNRSTVGSPTTYDKNNVNACYP